MESYNSNGKKEIDIHTIQQFRTTSAGEKRDLEGTKATRLNLYFRPVIFNIAISTSNIPNE